MTDFDLFGNYENPTYNRQKYITPCYNLTGLTQDNQTLIYQLPAAPDLFFNFFDSYFELKLRVTKPDNADVTGTTVFSTVNLPAHSLFKHIDVWVQDEKLLTHQNQHITNYFEQVLSFEPNCTYQQIYGFFKDTSGKFETFSDENSGYSQRRSLFSLSKIANMRIKTNTFPFNTKKYLPGNLKWRFNITIAHNDLIILAANGVADIKIIDCILKVDTIRSDADIFKSIHANFLSKKTATYPFSTVKATSFLIPQGKIEHRLEHNLLKPCVPALLLFALQPETAYLGAPALNPFKFSRNGLKELVLKLDGQNIYYENLKFSNDSLVSYDELQRLLGYKELKNKGLNISRKEYSEDFLIIPCALDKLAIEGDKTSHQLDIELKFDTALTANLRLIAYTCYTNYVDIKLISGTFNVTPKF